LVSEREHCRYAGPAKDIVSVDTTRPKDRAIAVGILSRKANTGLHPRGHTFARPNECDCRGGARWRDLDPALPITEGDI
jgi:hypothetical protein